MYCHMTKPFLGLIKMFVNKDPNSKGCWHWLWLLMVGLVNLVITTFMLELRFRTISVLML